MRATRPPESFLIGVLNLPSAACRLLLFMKKLMLRWTCRREQRGLLEDGLEPNETNDSIGKNMGRRRRTLEQLGGPGRRLTKAEGAEALAMKSA